MPGEFIIREPKPRLSAGGWNRKKILVKVDDNGCWICSNRATNKQGYYSIYRGGKELTLHRYIFTLFNPGHDIEGAYICHTCDDRACINPEHLYAGDAKTNAEDCVARGRHITIHGEDHANAKLSRIAVAEIRRLYGDASFTQLELATMYGVSQSVICNILNHKTWRVS